MSSPSDGPSSSSLPPPEESQLADRTSLIEKARAFLLSPTVRHEDEPAKRRFLEEKGLATDEIDELIRELPSQPPPVPPRTYPQPSPSHLLPLLGSLFRAFTWIAGLSGVLLVGYYRLILPRLSRSLTARHMLKIHQSELLGRLQGRIDDVKLTQKEMHNETSPQQDHESLATDIKSLADLPVNSAGEPTHPLGVVIRCAFLGEPAQRLTLEELYHRLLDQFPGLKTADEMEYKHFILRELSRSRSFENVNEGDLEFWFVRDIESSSLPAPMRPMSSIQSLENLRDTVLAGRRTNSYQHTFKSLTDLTAFLSRETYALYGTTTGFRHGLQGSHGHVLSPAEEDVRRDIRALKGLVLNRRTFAPSRPPPTPTTPSTG